jgi:hypothetical protein
VDSLNQRAHINKEEFLKAHSPISIKHPQHQQPPRFLDCQVRQAPMIHKEHLQVNNSEDRKVKEKEV